MNGSEAAKHDLWEASDSWVVSGSESLEAGSDNLEDCPVFGV